MKLSREEVAAGDDAFCQFWEGWQRMLMHSPDAGQPMKKEIWNHAWDAGVAYERGRAKTNAQINAKNTEPI